MTYHNLSLIELEASRTLNINWIANYLRFGDSPVIEETIYKEVTKVVDSIPVYPKLEPVDLKSRLINTIETSFSLLPDSVDVGYSAGIDSLVLLSYLKDPRTLTYLLFPEERDYIQHTINVKGCVYEFMDSVNIEDIYNIYDKLYQPYPIRLFQTFALFANCRADLIVGTGNDCIYQCYTPFQKIIESLCRKRNVYEDYLKKFTIFTKFEVQSFGLPVFEIDGPRDLHTMLQFDAKWFAVRNYHLMDNLSIIFNKRVHRPYVTLEHKRVADSLDYKQKKDKQFFRDTFKDTSLGNVYRPSSGFMPTDHRVWFLQENIRLFKDDFLNSRNIKLYDYLPFDKVKVYIDQNNLRTLTLLHLGMWMEKNL